MTLDLRLLDTGMRVLASALYIVLIVLWVRYQNIFVTPVFSLYLLLSLIRVLWQPYTIKASLFTEPLLLILRFIAAIEAVRLCFATSRRREFTWLVWLMLSVGAFGALALWLSGYRDLSGVVAAYASIRQYFHVSLGLACVMGAVCFMEAGLYVDPLPRNHYLIFTTHILVLAALGFYHPPAMTAWREIHIWHLSGVCVCLLLWSRLGPLLRL